MNDSGVLEAFEGHVDHADGPVDDFLAGGDDRLGLLAAEHDLGDLGGVGQVHEAGFDDIDAGNREAFLDLLAQLGRDLVGVGPERLLVLVVGVVRVMAGQLTDGRLALDGDEILVVVDVESGLGRVDDVPDDDGGDLNRIAAGVVDFDLLADQVGDTERHPVLGAERIGPVKTGRPDRAEIAADEREDHGLVGMKDEESAAGEPDEKQGSDTAEKGRAQGRLPAELDEINDGEDGESDVDRHDRPSADMEGPLFFNVDHWFLLGYRNDIIMIFHLSRGWDLLFFRDFIGRGIENVSLFRALFFRPAGRTGTAFPGCVRLRPNGRIPLLCSHGEVLEWLNRSAC